MLVFEGRALAYETGDAAAMRLPLAAARALGISRDTLRYRIEKHGLEAQARPALREAR